MSPQRSQPSPQPMPSASIRIRAARAAVWDFVISIEAALVTSPSLLEISTVPGTPDGLGHQRVYIAMEAGRRKERLVEVVDFQPMNRFATMLVRPRSTSTVFEGEVWELLEDEDGNTHLTWTLVPRKRLGTLARRLVLRSLRRGLQRVRRRLEEQEKEQEDGTT